MNKIKNIIKENVVDLSDYVHPETGEILEDGVYSKTEKTDLIEISYNDYSIVSTDAVKLLSKIINDQDLGRIMKMSATTKTELNVLYNHTMPHSNVSLQSYLEVKSKSTFHIFLNKMIKIGVLYKMKGNIHGAVRVIYMMNPHITRKRRTFDSEINTIFRDLSMD